MRSGSFARHGLVIASILLFDACGGEAAPAAPAENPAPVLAGVVPARLVAGFAPATVTLVGSGFFPGSRAHLNGEPRATTYVDANTLSVSLPETDLGASGAPMIGVVNPSPGGGTSNGINVPIDYPVPVATSVSPTSADAGRNFALPPVLVTISGSGFTSKSSMHWDAGSPMYIMEVTATSITGVVSSDRIATTGAHTLSVRNPAPGGGTSRELEFLSLNPVPVIWQLASDPAVTGSPLTLIVSGSGFNRSSIVRWNGADRPTNLVVYNLFVQLTESDIAGPGPATITVFNGAPGGGTSAPMTLTRP